MSTLYVLGTPIGNLEDLSPRALRLLGEVGAIAAEDTRVTSRLLARYGVRKPLLSYR
ncbi:MAG TPA: SAM-dependent methyltransferase, partial [Candidatus Dormibacteraeota bacterium]|nr:SAM-dependent methyltransferase [Candidatus Dormibacteraeota bacterium]